jgi:hypothetical protein
MRPDQLGWGARSGPLSAADDNNRNRISCVSYLTQRGQKERLSPLTYPPRGWPTRQVSRDKLPLKRCS